MIWPAIGWNFKRKLVILSISVENTKQLPIPLINTSKMSDYPFCRELQPDYIETLFQYDQDFIQIPYEKRRKSKCKFVVLKKELEFAYSMLKNEDLNCFTDALKYGFSRLRGVQITFESDVHSIDQYKKLQMMLLNICKVIIITS